MLQSDSYNYPECVWIGSHTLVDAPILGGVPGPSAGSVVEQLPTTDCPRRMREMGL